MPPIKESFLIVKNETAMKLIRQKYSMTRIIETYMNCIEEIINIPELIKMLDNCIEKGYLNNIIDEITLQSKVEYNSIDDDIDNEVEEN